MNEIIIIDEASSSSASNDRLSDDIIEDITRGDMLEKVNLAKLSHIPRFNACDVSAIAGLHPYRTPLDLVSAYLYQGPMLYELQQIDAELLGLQLISEEEQAVKVMSMIPSSLQTRLLEIKQDSTNPLLNKSADDVKARVNEAKSLFKSCEKVIQSQNLSDLLTEDINMLEKAFLSNIRTEYGISTESAALDRYEELTGHAVTNRNEDAFYLRFRVDSTSQQLEYTVHNCGYPEYDDGFGHLTYRNRLKRRYRRLMKEVLMNCVKPAESSEDIEIAVINMIKSIMDVACKGCCKLYGAISADHDINATAIMTEAINELPNELAVILEDEFTSNIDSMPEEELHDSSLCLFGLVESLSKPADETSADSLSIQILESDTGGATRLIRRRIVERQHWFASNQKVSSSISDEVGSAISTHRICDPSEIIVHTIYALPRNATKTTVHLNKCRLLAALGYNPLLSSPSPFHPANSHPPLQIDFMVVGRYDGISYQPINGNSSAINHRQPQQQYGQVVIECKNRVYGVNREAPFYDQIQLITYMIMAESSYGHLLECSSSGSGGSSKMIQEYEIRWHAVNRYGAPYHHDDNWHQVVMPRLCKFASFIRLLRADDGLRYQWLIAQDDHERYMLMKNYADCEHFDYDKLIRSLATRSRPKQLDIEVLGSALIDSSLVVESQVTLLASSLSSKRARIHVPSTTVHEK
jgi:hypothetical protein